MAGKIFNPKWLQRVKRIEREEEALNPKWLQKAKWIETLVTVWKKYAFAGAGACACLNDGSLPALRLHPPLAGKTERMILSGFNFYPAFAASGSGA